MALAFFEDVYHINSRDADPFGHCRPSALLGYLQEASTGAANAGRFSREELIRDYNVLWMLARIWYRLDRPVCMDRDLTIRTWHRGNPGLMMYRDYDLFVDGAHVGEAVSIWVLVNLNTHKLFRMSNVPTLIEAGGGPLCKDITLPKLRIPADLPLTEKRMLHYSDTDMNGHVNNSRYADFACDAIRLDRVGTGGFVSSVQLGFLAECKAGQELSLRAGQRDGYWYVEGSLEDDAPHFNAAVTISPLDNSGGIS